MVKSLPLYERRRKILLGEAEPTAEEVAAGEAVSEKDDPETAAETKAEREEAEKNLSEQDKAIKGKPHTPKFTLHLSPCPPLILRNIGFTLIPHLYTIGIPNFWLTVLRNHEGLSSTITEKDEAALAFLIDIRLEYLPDDTPGFKLLFDFAPNPFFENTILEKTYHYQVRSSN